MDPLNMKVLNNLWNIIKPFLFIGLFVMIFLIFKNVDKVITKHYEQRLIISDLKSTISKLEKQIDTLSNNDQILHNNAKILDEKIIKFAKTQQEFNQTITNNQLTNEYLKLLLK